MKFSTLVFLLIFLTHTIVFSSENTFHIVIDPGHGGQDSGATRDSFVEAKIVFQIAQKVKNNLDQEKDIAATLTRKNNTGLSLKNRVLFANELKADLFVSLHANTSNSEYVRGMEFYFNSVQQKSLESGKPANSKDQLLTNFQIIEKIKNDFMFYDKTEKSLMLTRAFKEKSAELEQKSIIKRAPFYVIEHTSMPSILIELGFISNRREAKKLISEEYQNEMARLLTSAILNYKEKSDKPKAL